MDIETLNLVHEFYEQSWNKLIVAISIAFAVFGVLVPYHIQQWQFKRNEKDLKKIVDKEINTMRVQIGILLLGAAGKNGNPIQSLLFAYIPALKNFIAAKAEDNIAIVFNEISKLEQIDFSGAFTELTIQFPEDILKMTFKKEINSIIALMKKDGNYTDYTKVLEEIKKR
jgi:hypothetical protein